MFNIKDELQNTFDLSFAAHIKYLMSDIQNDYYRGVVERCANDIIGLRDYRSITMLEDYIRVLNNKKTIWDGMLFTDMTNSYIIYVYEVALQIMKSLEEKAYGGVRYPDAKFYKNYEKVKALFNGV